MEIKLDYQRMADTVYALSALRAIETGSDRIIGRDEEEALFRRFEWALTEICIAMGPAVKKLNAREGIAEIETAGALIHKALEAAVVQSVLSDLGLSADSPSLYLRILRSLVYSLPYLTRN